MITTIIAAIGNKNFRGDYIITPNGTLLVYIPSGRKGEDRYKNVKKVDGADNIPSDSNSNTRTNNVSSNVKPKVLPINVEKDDYL